MSDEQAPQPGEEYAEHEEDFFRRARGWDGGPYADDYVDPEFASIEPPPSVMQPILIALIVAFTVFLGWQYRLDVAYFMSSSDAVALGEASELRHDEAYADQGNLALPSNRYVELDGIAYRELLTTKTRYRQLLGTSILMSEPTDPELLIDDIPQTVAEYTATRGVREELTVRGRLVEASALPPRESAILQNYSTHFGIRYCGIPVAPTVAHHVASLREAAFLRLSDELGREPTEAELTANAGPSCARAYLLYVDEEPEDEVSALIACLAFLAVLIGAALLLVRWLRRARQDA